MIVTDAPSPNFNPRAGGRRPDIIILHYTDTRTTFDALQILQSVERKVSSHYLVGDNGQVMRLVPEEMRAWHAGQSWWEGEGDLNSRSIGIEIQNPGHGFGYVPFPQVQMNAVLDLCRGIIERWGILPWHVLGHSDIAPDRKIDPGELFPWEWLAGQGVGLWPQPTETEMLDGAELLGDEDAIKMLMTRYGYDPSQEFTTLLTAFQRHFEGDIFTLPEIVGKPHARTVARMMALVRQRLALRPKSA